MDYAPEGRNGEGGFIANQTEQTIFASAPTFTNFMNCNSAMTPDVETDLKNSNLNDDDDDSNTIMNDEMRSKSIQLPNV